MYCEYIRQIIHIATYEDFQDIQTVILSDLRFEEIEKIYNLFVSPDKESQRIAKAEIEINLIKALEIYQEQETEIFKIYDKVEQFAKENNVSAVEFWEEKFNELKSLLNELGDFISDCFDLELRYYREIFQEQNRIELMQHFIPVYSKNRIKFETDILHRKGRTPGEEKKLSDYLINPENNYNILPLIVAEYQNKKPTEIYFMVFSLIKLEIFQKDAFENIKNLSSVIGLEFRRKPDSLRTIFQRKHSEYNQGTSSSKDFQGIEKHIEKIKEITLKK